MQSVLVFLYSYLLSIPVEKCHNMLDDWIATVKLVQI